jgi:diketogulonate reductase-like aldo/keto reductase
MIRHLGDSIAVPSIGQGTGYEIKNRKEQFQISIGLLKAIELGLNFIDTAENYSNGLCEIAVSRAIKKNRQKIIVASKFSPENSSCQKVINSCNQSLIRLKTDYIDLYQIHWPNPSINLEETISAMVKLKKQGKVREIGISNFSIFDLNKYKGLLIGSKIASLQCEYNLFEKTVEEDGTLKFCEDNNLLFIAYSPLDQGRFLAFNKDQQRILDNLSKKYHKTHAQIILSWLTRWTFVTAIVKTSNVSHLLENADILNFNIEKLDNKILDKAFFQKTVLIDTRKIMVSENGERSREVYTDIGQAISNKYNYIPSPEILAKSLKEGSFLRPVRLVPVKGTEKYLLINGRIRYWAWVIAFGTKKPIPALIRNNL